MSEPGGLKSQIESAIDRKLNYWGQRPILGELYIVYASLVAAFNIAKAALTYRRFGLADRAVKSNAPDAELIIYEAGLREASDVEWAMKYRKQFLRAACIRWTGFVGVWFALAKATERGYLGRFGLPLIIYLLCEFVSKKYGKFSEVS